MNNLASFLLKGSQKDFYENENSQLAFKLYEESASLGNSKAITNLGICYLKGLGVDKDTINARKLFNKSALLREPDGIFYKAYFLLKEASKTQNEELFFECATLLRETIALQKNHSDANYYMGFLYENGLGVD